MSTVITELKATVAKNSDSGKYILTKQYPRLSPRKIKGIIQDIQSAIDSEITDEQLAMYLMNDGLIV